MTPQRVTAAAAWFVCVTVLGLALASSAMADGPRTNVAERIRRQCAERSISGGVLVYLGNPTDALLADLAETSGGRFLVEGLLPGDGDLAVRRERLLAGGLYGKVSLARWSGPDLPFIPNLVNVLVIYESPILVLYKNCVLFARANRKMSALDADAGETLWEAEHLSGGHFSPKDLIVVDDLAWSANIAGTRQRNSGTFVGRDLLTGDVVREIKPARVTYHFPHHRCYRVKATSRYILASKTGIEFYDTKECSERINHWVRGGCLYGIMPANGLIYAPMHSCACFLDSKLTGFNALAPSGARDDTPTSPAPKRLEKGPAYGKTRTLGADVPGGESWPTYRADNARSGYAPVQVADNVKVKWEGKLPGRPSALTVACGRVFAAAVDQHCLVALDEKTGEMCWRFFADGRIDSPPTLYKGSAYFGSADGHVYCLDAADGALAWRFQVAPRERQLFSHGQLESVWPVSGSVLINSGKLFCVGGRSSFLDGGLPFVRLDVLTGALEAESRIDAVDPKSGQSIQMLPEQSEKPPANPDMQMPSALADILSSDGKNIFMRVEKLSEDGKRIGTFTRKGTEDEYDERHIFSWGGFLDGSWLHRVYMSHGNGRVRKGTYLEWFTYGETNPDGRLLVMDAEKVYGYGLKPKFHTWSSTFQDFQLFSVNKKVAENLSVLHGRQDSVPGVNEVVPGKRRRSLPSVRCPSLRRPRSSEWPSRWASDSKPMKTRRRRATQVVRARANLTV